MRAKWQFHPNHNAATLHVGELLPELSGYGNQETDEAHELKWSLLAIPGVREISGCTRYQLFILKGEVFEWDEITPRVEAVIADHFGKPLELAESIVDPPFDPDEFSMYR